MSIVQIIQREYLKKRQSMQQLTFLSLGNVSASIGGFVIVILLANILDQNDYGNYKYVFSLVGILSVLSLTGGFRNITLQATAQGYDGFLRYLFKRNLLLSLPMLIGGGGVSVYYFIHDNNFLGSAIGIATITTIIGNMGVLAHAYVNGRKKYKEIFYIQTIQTTLSAVALITITQFRDDLLSIFITSVTTSALTSVLLFLYVQKMYVRNNEIDDKLLKYGKHLNVLSIISTIMMHIDSILIFKIIGSQGLALYAIATPFVDRIIGFFKSSYYFALPKYSEMGSHRARIHLYKRSLLAFLLGWVIFGIYYLLAPIIFSIFFPKYPESINLSILFALNIPLVAISILPEAFLDSLIEARNKYIVKAVTTFVRLVTMLLFIYPFGIAGVILSELIARAASLVTILILINKSQKSLTERAGDI